MSTPKHTPGPWTVREDQAFTFRIIGPKTKDGLAICGTKENANLIAAAPEMLEVLEVIKHVLLHSPDTVTLEDGKKAILYHFELHDIKQVIKAIKKAKGE